MSETSATSLLGGIFAFIYLSTEVSLKVLSTIMLEIGYTWHIIFLIYFIVAVMSSFLMYFIYDYRGRVNMSPQEMQASFFSKVTAAGKLLIQVRKSTNLIYNIQPLCSYFALIYIDKMEGS